MMSGDYSPFFGLGTPGDYSFSQQLQPGLHHRTVTMTSLLPLKQTTLAAQPSSAKKPKAPSRKAEKSDPSCVVVGASTKKKSGSSSLSSSASAVPDIANCSRVRPDKIEFALSFRRYLEKVNHDPRRNNKNSLQKIYEEWTASLAVQPILTYSESLFAMYLCGVIKVHKNGDVTYKNMYATPEIVAGNFAKVVPADQHAELTNVLYRAILRLGAQPATLVNIRQQIADMLGTKKLSDTDWRNLTNVLNWSDDFFSHTLLLDGVITQIHAINTVRHHNSYDVHMRELAKDSSSLATFHEKPPSVLSVIPASIMQRPQPATMANHQTNANPFPVESHLSSAPVNVPANNHAHGLCEEVQDGFYPPIATSFVDSLSDDDTNYLSPDEAWGAVTPTSSPRHQDTPYRIPPAYEHHPSATYQVGSALSQHQGFYVGSHQDTLWSPIPASNTHSLWSLQPSIWAEQAPQSEAPGNPIASLFSLPHIFNRAW